MGISKRKTMGINNLNKSQLNALVFMRVLIGWHFLYEGIIKLYNPSWTAKAYLLSSEGIFKSMFVKLADESFVGFVDGFNIAILVVVGLLLVLGVMTRRAAVLGAFLLCMYYLSHPAFPGMNQGPAEGSYWVVNKNLIEMAALIVLYLFPTGSYFGLAALFEKKNEPQTI